MHDRDLTNLVKHAADAQRFEQWVLGEDAEALPPVVAGRIGWRWWAAGSAAAACVAVGVFTLSGLRTGLRTGPSVPVAEVGEVVQPDIDEPLTGRVVVVADEVEAPAPCTDRPEVDLSRVAFLDPDAEDGLPSLTEDRSVVMAVYHGGSARAGCECLSWLVTRAGETIEPAVMSSVLEQAACDGHEGPVTIYAITGPRMSLPFHDDEARELMACLSPGNECTADGKADDLCAAAYASLCVSDGLAVQATTLEVASR